MSKVKNYLRSVWRLRNQRKERKRIDKFHLGHFGKNSSIFDGFDYAKAENIIVWDNVQVGAFCKFYALSKIEIGSGTIISDCVQIRTAGHNYNSEDLAYLPFDGRVYEAPVLVGENVWIGTNALILGGVTIGEGAVIGAGSVVAKDVEPGAVVAGNPARVIKYRNMEVYRKLKDAGKQYVKYSREIERLFAAKSNTA